MLNDAKGFRRIIIACGKTDLRRGIDGLAAIVQEQFHLDPGEKDVLFLFCGTKMDRIKGLVYEGDRRDIPGSTAFVPAAFCGAERPLVRSKGRSAVVSGRPEISLFGLVL